MPITSEEEKYALKKIAPIIETLIRNPRVVAFLKSAKQKGRELLLREDFIWHEILLSFATWGSSRGAKNLKFEELTYKKLSRLKKVQRRSLVAKEFTQAKLRYAKNKTGYLLYNLSLIEDMGGLKEANKTVLDNANDCDAKIKILKKFKGIGEKYARNIMMDAYHPQFHDSIAVDQRIKNISKELGLRIDSYDDYIQFYRKVACKVGIQPWELDRLLYKCEKSILQVLKGSNKTLTELIEPIFAPAN